jgi:hypothetical protein
VKIFALALALCCLPFSAWAEDYTLRLHYSKAPAHDVLRVYEKLSARPVFIALDLDALVTIESEKEISAAEAIELIRKTLLERYGIELRIHDRGETLAGWSKDPKYPRRSDGPIPEEAGAKGRPRATQP